MLKNIVKKRVIVIPIMLIMFVLFTFIGGYLAERMNLAEEQFSEGRGKFQLFYLNEIYERPHLLLFGMITKSKLGFWRVPHNQYLGMLYIGGLLYLLFFLILLAQIYRRRSIRKESKHSISIIYPFFGFILPYAADPNGLVVYFPIILAISAGFIDKANIKNRDKTFLSDYKENSKF